MHPNSYAVDSLSKSQELASTILAASSPPQISSACAATSLFLRSHSPDHSRHFFSIAFPALISKLFGYGGLEETPASPHSPPPFHAWIDAVFASDAAALADDLFALLSPAGPLLSAVAAVDRLDLVKYVFPTERLPEWTRFLLSSEKDCKVVPQLCPIFRNRVKEDSIKGLVSQVQLNVFEYYMFWFAYYPVCRGNNENSDVSVVNRKNRRFKLENWVSSISGFSSCVRQSNGSDKIKCNLYPRLLYAYLVDFVPANASNSHHQSYRSSMVRYSVDYDGRAVTWQAEFFVNTLVHFLLVENDFSPFPVELCKSFGVNFPLRSVLGETPPTSGLGEAVKLFVRYLNLSSSVVQGDGNESSECNGGVVWRTPGSFERSKSKSGEMGLPYLCSVGLWNSTIQRPLYRFILRTFLFCPIGSSIKNVSEVFSVWIMYLEPWKMSWDEFLDLDSGVDGSAKAMRKEALQSRDFGYSQSWQGYVLSNYLYYSSLVMHFIGFAHKFLHTDVEIIVQMVLKVISILTSSKELVDLIRTMDSVFHSNQARSGKPMWNNLYRYVAFIREQLKDWEDGLSETEADGSFLHENWNKDLRLFSDGEDGGQQLLQLFILRAEAELQTISGDNLARSLQCIDLLKSQLNTIFGSNMIKRLSFSPEPKQLHQPRDDIFKPRREDSRLSENTQYKGDWMKRPISNDEVAWLAKLLVSLSDWVNENIGLNQPRDSQLGPSWLYVDVPGDDVDNICGPKDTANAVVYALGSWLLMVCVTVVNLMRKHGMRLNLRILASKKVVMVVILYVVFCVLRRTF